MKDDLKRQLDDCYDELNDIKLKMEKIPVLDKTRMYLTQYALIRSCGTVEYVYRAIIADFFEEKSPIQIHNYLDKTIRNGSMSAKYSNMLSLLGKFDKDWKNDFAAKVRSLDNFQRLIDSSNSLVTDRHAFAHGKSTSISLSDIYQYYDDVVKLIDVVNEIINNN